MERLISVEDNLYGFNKDKATGGLLLKYLDPCVSVPIVLVNETDLIKEELCKRTNIENSDGGFYLNGDLITKNMQKSIIVKDLVKLAEEELNNANNDLFLGNIIKKILKDMTLKHVDNDKFLLTEADLIKGLYGITEEEVSKSL